MRETVVTLPGRDFLPGLPEDAPLRVGSEGCARLVPSAREIRELPHRLGAPPERLTLVTPLCGPRELAPVVDSALAAREAGWREVVVNDWGVLRSLGPLPLPTAGRLLLRLRRGPGEGDPWPTLDLPSRDYFAWGPLHDPPFLEFLRQRGVVRLELDPPRHWHPLPPVPDFALSLHADHRMVSLTGNCHHLPPGETGSCHRGCLNVPVRLTAPQLPGFLVAWGRLLLEPAGGDVPADLPPSLDRLIVTPSLFPSSPICGTPPA